jgi:hypothetical protein
VNAADGRWCVNINEGSINNTVRNNILYNLHPSRGVIVIDDSSRPGFVSDYNSLMNRMSPDGDATILDLAEWQALGYDAHSFVATPAQHFLVPGSDFHLLSSSPAVDAGTATGAPSFDLGAGRGPSAPASTSAPTRCSSSSAATAASIRASSAASPGCRARTRARPACSASARCSRRRAVTSRLRDEACEQDADCGAASRARLSVRQPECAAADRAREARLTLKASPDD